ncbi:hypothetical protein [Paraburkholderia sp. CNPSo 3272]|uniref:TerC family protein n=1 Tax=Paraburkholderia sp. CNPSo 3272 TaxID=2940931 RepID=UPI00281692D6|nr:hypothetical protein [Paraburkholderia sp. CNPSo 3272]
MFGVFRAVTGVKMLLSPKDEPGMNDSAVLRWLRRKLPVTPQLEGRAFVVRQAHPRTGKPALLTTDPFIVYTSNIFAVLGLRALYFALAAMAHRFHYLKHALALVLVFIGAKIFLVGVIGKIPALFSLGVTAALLAGGVVVSLVKTQKPKDTLGTS